MTDQEIISAKWVEQMQKYSKADVLMTRLNPQLTKNNMAVMYRCRHCQFDWSPNGFGPYESDHTTENCAIGPRLSGWRT